MSKGIDNYLGHLIQVDFVSSPLSTYYFIVIHHRDGKAISLKEIFKSEDSALDFAKAFILGKEHGVQCALTYLSKQRRRNWRQRFLEEMNGWKDKDLMYGGGMMILTGIGISLTVPIIGVIGICYGCILLIANLVVSFSMLIRRIQER